MKSSTIRKPKAVPQQRNIPDPELRELLAHLGRLLAQEYVALLTQSKETASGPEEQGR